MVVLRNMVAIWMVSAKLATLGFPKIKNCNKRYDIISSSHDVTNKILSRASIYTVDVVISPK